MFNIIDVASPSFPDIIGNYSENIIAFVLGLILGILIVVIIKIIKKRKSNK